MYAERNQLDPQNPNCEESSAYPAAPDSEYGWEKLFSERLFLAYKRNYKMNVHIARFHNIFGPEGSWNNGKEKSPAAICRKVAEAKNGGTIEMWGDGKQTRSYLYIDECLNGVRKLMDSDFSGPVNIGSEEMITLNQLAEMVMDIAGKNSSLSTSKVHSESVADRQTIGSYKKLGWKPTSKLKDGLMKTYEWISEQLEKSAPKK